MAILKRERVINPTYTIEYQPHLVDQLFSIKELYPYHFGMEMIIFAGETQRFLCTPPLLRLGEKVKTNAFIDEQMTTSEVVLASSSILPIYTQLESSLWLYMAHLKDVLMDDEEMHIQWLFQKQMDWYEQGIKLYESYLKGNDYPLTSGLFRGLQEKVVKGFGKVANFDMNRQPIQAVEDKIVDEIYQVQMKVVIKADKKRTKILLKTIQEMLKVYDGYNSLELIKVGKGAIQDYKDRVMNDGMILSLTEIKTLLGIKNDVQIISNDTPKENTSMYAHLPSIENDLVEVDTSTITNLENALKRLNLVQNTLSHSTIQTGARLTKVTADIPEGKNFTDFEKKVKDIQAHLGIEGLSIIQGDQAGTVSFLLPNTKPSIVTLRELIEDTNFEQYRKKNSLAFIVGVDEIGKPIYLSLKELKHLLIAGTTGSGKSEFEKAIMTTLLLTHTPKELVMYLIDPKLVEFQYFAEFPHVLDVIDEMSKAYQLCQKLVAEMESRYKKFKENGVKDLETYNQKAKEKIPSIVCVIDEYADLVMQEPKVEDLIVRLGQKSRAAGIHLIIATQRPSKDIVSSNITTNFQNAISFNLGNNTNYRTVFGSGIPYSSLMDKGDGVFRVIGYHKEFQRFQSPIVCPDKSKEEELYQTLTKQFKGVERVEIKLEEVESELDQLKRLIATTGETKVTVLREDMQIGHEKLNDLLEQLIEEGWLIKHKSKAKGYELIATEDMMAKYRIQ